MYEFYYLIQGIYPYEHYSNDYHQEFSFNLEELNYFFIKKSILDRENLINKILEKIIKTSNLICV